MDTRLENRLYCLRNTHADLQESNDHPVLERAIAPPSLLRLILPTPQRSDTPRPSKRRILGAHPRWTRPHRPFDRRFDWLTLDIHELQHIRMPRIPGGISEDESTTLPVLAGMILEFHRSIPSDHKDEYIRQLMKFAGEKAGQIIRGTLELAATT